MARSPSKVTKGRNIVVSELSSVLLTTVEPLVHALDSRVNEMGDQVTQPDAGHDQPSTRDMGLRIILGNILQTLHNQCYGVLNTRTGTKMPNAKEQLDTSEQRLANMADRITNGTTTEADLTAIHWFNVNEARFAFLNQMISAYADVYKKVTNEEWKPFERREMPPVKVDDATQARLLAVLKKAGEKNKKDLDTSPCV